MFLRPPKVVQRKGALRSQSRDLKMFTCESPFACMLIASFLMANVVINMRNVSPTEDLYSSHFNFPYLIICLLYCNLCDI